MSKLFILLNKEYQKQLDEIPVVFPTGSTLANIFLSLHEGTWLKNCPLQFNPKIYRRYIDDTFLVFSVQQVENFKQYLNLNTMLISNSFLRLKQTIAYLFSILKQLEQMASLLRQRSLVVTLSVAFTKYESVIPKFLNLVCSLPYYIELSNWAQIVSFFTKN